MVLLEFKNLLDNYKVAIFSEYLDRLPEEDAKAIKNFFYKIDEKDKESYIPTAHREFISYLKKIKDKHRLNEIRNMIMLGPHEGRNVEHIPEILENPTINKHREMTGKYISYTIALREINKRLGLDPYEGINKKTLDKAIKHFLHPDLLSSEYKKDDEESIRYHNSLEIMAKDLISEDPKLKYKVKEHINNLIEEEKKRYGVSRYEYKYKYHLEPYLGRRETTVLYNPRYTKEEIRGSNIRKYFSSLGTEKSDKLPTEKIINKS
jgi:hypothetical protein